MKPYSYSILRYSHDPTSGEAVNVGVLVYEPSEGFARLELNERYGHLVELFRDFCKEDFEMGLQGLKVQLKDFQPWLRESAVRDNLPGTARELAAYLLPDGGGAFHFGQLGQGRGRNLDDEAKALFKMLVADQRPETKVWNRRSDAAVWNIYLKALKAYRIPQALKPAKIQTPTVPIDFKHCYNNGNRHALQPLSLEYARPEDIIAQAAKWKAFGDELAETPGFGKLHLLLGSLNPQAPIHTRAHQEATAEAIQLLERTKVEHIIVREEAAADYARELATDMREHKVLD